MQETWIWSLGREDPLEKKMTTHFSILACRIPWTKEPVGHRPWDHKESDMTERLNTHFLSLADSWGPVNIKFKQKHNYDKKQTDNNHSSAG